MPFSFKTLLKSPPCWLRPDPLANEVILTTIARVVRNLPGYPFPGWSTAEDRAAVAKKILPVVRSYPRFRYCYHAEMPELDHQKRCILLERKQITPGMAARQDGCHLLLSKDQEIFAMVNEEEHLCLHVAKPGFQMEALLDTVEDISRHLEEKLRFARSAKEGYLTSMPQETGAGLQFFAVLHLPALSMTGQIEKVRNALEKMCLNLSPFNAENDDCGNLYILYTRAVPQGETAAVAEHFAHICSTLSKKEQRMADLEFEREDGPDPIDLIYRAYGLLRHAFTLDYKELLGALSLIRLGLQHHLFFARVNGELNTSISPDVLHLYELTPAVLRFRFPGLENASQACRLRSGEVREVLRSFILLFP